MRYGTRTTLKRRWTPSAHRPVCPMHIGYEFGYLYAAICPYHGDLFCMLLPWMNKECFHLFLQKLEEHVSQKTTLFLDRASTHQHLPKSRIRLKYLPAAAPELNPVERFFKELRKELSNTVFMDIEQVENKLEQVLKRYFKNPSKIISLTLYPYLDTSF